MSIAREVAEASRVLENELPSKASKASYPNVLVDIAKEVQRRQTKVRRLRRELKIAESELKFTKKELRAVIAQIAKGEA